MHSENYFSAYSTLKKTFIIALCIQPAYSYANRFAHDNQELVSYIDERYDSFLKPIDYSRKSMEWFFSTVFNDRSYAEHFLAFNFSHILELLNFAHISAQPCAYSKSIIKLFSQKMKTTTFLNAYAVNHLIEKLSVSVGNFCKNSAEKEKNALKECLYNFFITDFNSLKRNPENAIDELAGKMQAISNGKNDAYDIPVSELQRTVKEFLEIALSKIIWSVEDQHEIWTSVKCIADQLQILLVHGVLEDMCSLDELYWTLISRFSYFLSMAEELDPSCLEAMEQDLLHADLPLWNLPESEEFITTKLEYVQHAVLSAKIRSKAYQAGMITDRIAPFYQRSTHRIS